MPKAMEDVLKAVADKYARKGKLKVKKGDDLQEAKNRFIYGTMRKTGWKPTREVDNDKDGM